MFKRVRVWKTFHIQAKACGNRCVRIPRRLGAVGDNSLYGDTAYLTVCLTPAGPQGCAAGGRWILFPFIPVGCALSMKSPNGFKSRGDLSKQSSVISPGSLTPARLIFSVLQGVSKKAVLKSQPHPLHSGLLRLPE